MRNDDFRMWLGKRRWMGAFLTQKAKNSRVQRCKQIERGLQGLGFATQTELEDVFGDGLWNKLLERLDELKKNPDADREAVKSVVPQAENPKGKLGNLHAAAKQYGYFLKGLDPNYGASDNQDVDEDELTDDELLARFDGCSHFNTARSEWSEEQRAAFCKMARLVNAVGLDWYDVQMPEIRFGRRSPEQERALGTLGRAMLRKNAGFIEFSHQNELLKLTGKYYFDEQSAERFATAISDAGDAIGNWLPPSPPRMGFWPDETAIVADEPSVEVKPEPTNLILYGPPGTGKTYRTALEAVKLCCPDADYAESAAGRAALMEHYRVLEAENRIKFVTFHQNYDYENFVEGLRPETGDAVEGEGTTAGFRLVARAGLFCEICALAEHARTRTATSTGLTGYDFSGRSFWKMGQGAIGSEEDVYESAIANNYIALGWGGAIDWSPERFSTLEAIKTEWLKQNGEEVAPSNWTQIWPFRCKMNIGDIVIVPYGNTMFRAIGEVTSDYRFEPSAEGYYAHRRNVRWLLILDEPLPLDTIVDVNFTMRTLYSVPSKRVNLPVLGRLVHGKSHADTPVAELGSPDQFVLIIDEINRANISKVFGELITLIEPDKRLGMPNPITLTLPYSKKKDFGVPANLHIIGTMNTADRSIALLDTALRRRFTFREMAPEPKLLTAAAAQTGIDLVAVLATINQRIEYLIDREHCIGHAFFIGCDTEDKVHEAMRDKVIPLLQEYFFEDWSRIAAVLGNGFIGHRTLKCPLGEGDDRKSWFVRWGKQADGRTSFPADAYTRLLSRVHSEAMEAENGE